MNASLYGSDLFGNTIEPPSRGKLGDAFLIPPFSVLNAREGWWQERKRAWLAYGIESEVGRGTTIVPNGSHRPASADGCYSRGYHTVASGNAMQYAGGFSESHASGASVFDPVLCELAYRWFCPPGGLVLDPFCGGSVRGLVAGMLGYRYWGCDLRAEQVAANEAQRHIAPDATIQWVCGDAIEAVPSAPDADFVFSCPPYGDLEVYSDDARDLSAMDHHAFVAAYKRIILRACERLKQDRFACFVVGDFRDKRTGYMRSFPEDTAAAFRDSGLHLYNEAILVTACGSLPIRAGKQFASGRKLGKTHQNVLVFVKGDPRKATAAIVA